MIRRTLAMIRSSEFPTRLGICPSNISEVAQAVNTAQEQLLYDPTTPDEGWWGGYGRMRFTVMVQNRHTYVVTPRDVARLILIDVCKRPVIIRNGFYEFLEFGSGLRPRAKSCPTGAVGQDCGCNSPTAAYERDSVVTLAEQTVSPATIRIMPVDPSDVGLQVLLQGLDQNGNPVISTDTTTQAAISGEYLTLALPFVDSTYQYQAPLTGIQKAASQGPVKFFQVDPNSGAQTFLSSMDPNETSALYRRYLVDGLPIQCCDAPSGSVQIDAQARFDLVPVQSDSDYLLIQNIPALIQEGLSFHYSTMESPTSSKLMEQTHNRALQLLNGELDLHCGKTNVAIRVPLFNGDRVRLQPR